MSTEQKLTLAREPLLEALGMLRAGVERRSNLPILGHVLLEQNGDTLTLTATNLETEIATHIAVVRGQIAPATLPAAKFYDIVRLMPAESALTLTFAKDSAEITQGRSRFKLNVLPADIFPKQAIAADAPSFVMTELQLACLLSDVSRSMAVNDARYYLNGMLLSLHGDTAMAVATDGHRLAMSAAAVQLPRATDVSPIVPRHAVGVLSRVIGTSDSEVTVRWTRNMLAVTSARATVVTKLVDGKYPKWEKVCSNKNPLGAQLNRREWLEAVRRARVVTDSEAPGLAVSFRAGAIVMVATTKQEEVAEESVAMEYDGPEIHIGLNANYLIDALESLDGEQVVVSVRDATSPIYVRGAQEKSALHVIMPLRL